MKHPSLIRIITKALPALAALSLLLGGTPGRAAEPEVGPAGRHPLFIVTLLQTLVVVNSETAQVVATVKLPGRPGDVVMSPDGGRIAIGAASGRSLWLFDTTSNELQEVLVGQSPHQIAFRPDSGRLYTSNANDNTVSVIDPSVPKVIATVPGTQRHAGCGRYPGPLTVHPTQARLYVGNRADQTISVIDIGTNQPVPLAPIPGTQRHAGCGHDPVLLALAPDGTRLTVANQNDTLSVINTQTNTRLTTLQLPARASIQQIRPSRDGTLLLVLVSQDSAGPGTQRHAGCGSVYLLRADNHAQVGRLLVGRAPQVMIEHPQRPLLYVVNQSTNDVTVLDLAAKALADTLPIGRNPADAALSVDGGTLWVVNQSDRNLVFVDTTNDHPPSLRGAPGQHVTLEAPPALILAKP
jgi:YVTN family beta-propeller protein